MERQRSREQVAEMHSFALQHGLLATGEKFGGISRERVRQLFAIYDFPKIGGQSKREGPIARRLSREYLEQLSKLESIAAAKKAAGCSERALHNAFAKHNITPPKRRPKVIDGELLKNGIAGYQRGDYGIHDLTSHIWVTSTKNVYFILRQNNVAIRPTGVKGPWPREMKEVAHGSTQAHAATG